MENKVDKIKMLITELNVANNSYYNGITDMSDQEFDLKLEELKKLEAETGVILSNSPTQHPGIEVVSEINKVVHSHPMLSLDKCHHLDEIQKFMNKHECLISVKLDGLTISAEYNDGILTKLESRGNGIEGQDVMLHKNSFVNLPLTIDKQGKYIIDGECLITYDDFEKINSNLSDNEKFSNPRNTASGTLSLLDSSISKERFLRFVAWNVIEDDENDNDFVSRLRKAKDLGFTVVPYVIIDKGNVSNNNLQNALDKIKELATKNSYPMDGAVITMRDVEYGKSLGKTDKFFRHSISYKYEDQTYPTKMKYIDWTMGKSGILTPTAVFEPVEIEGSIVERASLHNISVMNMLDITKGCTANVYKANCIIPQIESVEDDGDEKYEIPSVCPICGHPTEIITENSSSVLMCTNENCSGKLLGKFNLFVSREAMNIDGLAESQLQAFIDNGWLKNVADIYNLKEHRNEIIKLDGFAQKGTDKLLDAIDASRYCKLANFIRSFCIDLVGKTASKQIAKFCNNDIKLFNLVIDNKTDLSQSIDGFGSKMNASFHAWFDNEDNMKVFSRLLEVVQFADTVTKETEMSLESSIDLLGQTFCITGKVAHFTNRDAFVSSVEAHNGKYLSGVSAKLDWLINNDVESASGKNKKMHELGKADHIISEQQYLEMIGEKYE